jgi:hypothetical protein
MSSTDSSVQGKTGTTTTAFDRMHFPEIIDGKISTEEFLQAAREVVWTVGAYPFLTSKSEQQNRPIDYR